MITSERGSMLVVALWSLAILSLMAMGAGTAAWTEMKLTSYQIDRLKSERLLQGGLEVARQVLSDPKAPMATSFKDGWANQTSLFQRAELPDGCFSILRPGSGAPPAWGLEDEAGRLNLNTASPDTLRRLFGDDQEDAIAAVLEWRKSGGRVDGLSPTDDYGSLPHPYARKSAPFESVEELLMVQNVSAALYERVAPYLTVYTNGQVNINTASRPVLLALGFSDNLADRILRYRVGSDGREGTEDDGVFSTVSSVEPALREEGALMLEESSALSAARPYLTVRSTCFRAHFELSPDCTSARPFQTAQVVLAASGLQGQWIIKHYSTL